MIPKHQIRLLLLIQIKNQRRSMCFRHLSPELTPLSIMKRKLLLFKKVKSLSTQVVNRNRSMSSVPNTTKVLLTTHLQIRRVLQEDPLIQTHRERPSILNNLTKNDDQFVISLNVINIF